MHKALAVGVLLGCAIAVADTLLKSDGATIGPITSINCVGPTLLCARTGSTGRIFVDAGAPNIRQTCDAGAFVTGIDGGLAYCDVPAPYCASADAGAVLTCLGSLTCSSSGSGGTITGQDTYAVVGCAAGSFILGIDAGTAYCGVPADIYVKSACDAGQFAISIDGGTLNCGSAPDTYVKKGCAVGSYVTAIDGGDIYCTAWPTPSCTGATCWVDGGVLFITVP